jgi:predicted dehydrogenase
VGLAGCGVGLAHARAYMDLPDQFELAAVCDTDEARASATAHEFGSGYACTSFDALCSRDDLDVIDICTPSYLHSEHSLQALSAGKHVICEKPVAGSLKGVDDLISAEARSGRRLMPIRQYRFGHGAQKLKFLIEDRWQTELGGPLVTLAIHAHDLLLYVLGPVKSVFARAATLVNPIETEDCASATVEMADGSLASLSVTTGSSQEISRHRSCFSGLSAESNLRPYDYTGDPWTFTGDTAEQERAIGKTLARFESLPEGYVGQLWRLHNALRDDLPPPVTLVDARTSLELTTAIYTSIQSGQGAMLPIGEDHPEYAGWQPKRG